MEDVDFDFMTSWSGPEPKLSDLSSSIYLNKQRLVHKNINCYMNERFCQYFQCAAWEFLEFTDGCFVYLVFKQVDSAVPLTKWKYLWKKIAANHFNLYVWI